MTRTRTTPIEEAFGLIAVEEYGGKVRLMTEDELWPWIETEVDVERGLGRPEREIRIHILSKWGDAGLRLYLKAMAEQTPVTSTISCRKCKLP